MRCMISCGAALSIVHCRAEHNIPVKSMPRWGFGRNSTWNPTAANKKGLNMLIHVIRFLRSWRLCSDILVELSRKSDAELSAMGITRSDIPRVAFERTLTA
jgi:uncharacterized protein YjiS (DUF1127 family)